MAQEVSLPQLSTDTHTLRTDQDAPSPSIQTSLELGKSSSPGSNPRRPPRVLESAGQIPLSTKKQARRYARPKSVSFGPQNSSSGGSAAGVVGTPQALSHTSKMKRVSKAKKGKKVHACDFGCGKVYSRREHQKRHEANHRTEYEFPCTVEGCRHAFQRKDLLIRHLDKQHNMPMKPGDIKSPPARASARESFSAVSVGSTSTTGPISPEEPLKIAPGFAVPPACGLLLGSPAIQDGFSAIQPHQLSHQVSQLSLTPVLLPDLRGSIQAMPGLDYGPFASGGMYSSSCSSPMSDLAYSQDMTQFFPYGVKSQSISPASSTEHTRVDLEIGSPANGHFGGAFNEEGSLLPPVGTPAPSSPVSQQFPDITVEPSLSVSISSMDGDGYISLRRSLIGEEDALLQINREQIQHYLECYRKCFDPFFPIIHHPTAKAGLPQRCLVAAAMIAIGAQFSPRENAKTLSAALHEKCVEVLAKLLPITSRSKISDQQSVILLEAFSRYRGRSRTVQMSSGFQTLYASLLKERERLKTYPPIYPGSGYLNDCDPKFENSRQDWLDHETKRRMLLAAFVLDTHQYAFFQQLSYYFPGVSKGLDLPALCSSEVWECSGAKDWRRLATRHIPVDLARLQNGKLAIPASINAFESSIIQCCQIQIQTRLLSSPSTATTPTAPPVVPDALSTSRATLFTHHALHLATRTPILQLLLVSGESWLFGTKTPDPHVWTDAKRGLRAWLSTPSAAQAVWHATHLLRLSLVPSSCSSRSSSFSSSSSDADVDNADASPGPLDLLHEHWCLYLAALVCWAFGHTARHHKQPPETASPVWAWPSAAGYLAAMDVARWQYVAKVPERACTRGLLEAVRARLVGEQKERGRGSGWGMGRLLVEAVEVLGGLVGGTSRLVEF